MQRALTFVVGGICGYLLAKNHRVSDTLNRYQQSSLIVGFIHSNLKKSDNSEFPTRMSHLIAFALGTVFGMMMSRRCNP